MSPWVNVALNGISAAATTAVAIYVAQISKRQWTTNAEKLRLDLYDRRLQIYLQVLAFYQELIGWDDEPEQLALQKPFIAAVRESRFMFPPESGVHKLLEEFSRHAFYVVKFTESREALHICTKEVTDLALQRIDHVNWILASFTEIERRMAPYLNFHRM